MKKIIARDPCSLRGRIFWPHGAEACAKYVGACKGGLRPPKLLRRWTRCPMLRDLPLREKARCICSRNITLACRRRLSGLLDRAGRQRSQSAARRRLPRAKWALKVRNARNRWHLEIPAIQLIAPNLPDAANYEAERERGQDFESHHHC